MENKRVLAKFARIRMSEELSELLRSMPFKRIREQTSASLVYSGVGALSTGAVSYPVSVRVSLSEDGIKAAVVSEKAGIDVRGPFGNPDERAEFSEAVRATVARKVEALRS